MMSLEHPSLSPKSPAVEKSKAAEESRTDTANRWERTQSVIESSRQQLHRSDEIMKWCENFGPRGDSRANRDD